MEAQEYRLTLEGADEGLIDLMADDLTAELRQAARAAEISRERTDPEAQDLGSVLLLVLSSPALVPVVKALIGWLKSTHKVKVTLQYPDGRKVQADNLTQGGMLKLARAFNIDPGEHA